MLYTLPDFPSIITCPSPELISIISSSVSTFLGLLESLLLPNAQTVPFDLKAKLKPCPLTVFADTDEFLLSITFIQIFLVYPSSPDATISTLPILFPVILKFGTKSFSLFTLLLSTPAISSNSSFLLFVENALILPPPAISVFKLKLLLKQIVTSLDVPNSYII